MDTSLQLTTVHQISAQKPMADPDFHETDLDPSITTNCTNHSFTDTASCGLGSTSTTQKLLGEQFGASPTLENGFFRLSPAGLTSCIHINVHNTLRLFSGIQTRIPKSADPPNESSSTFTDHPTCVEYAAGRLFILPVNEDMLAILRATPPDCKAHISFRLLLDRFQSTE